MKTIQITLKKFVPGKAVAVDEHPIVNDDSYCEVVEIPSELTYEYDGIKCSCSGKKATKEELIKQIIPQTIFDVWFEDNWTKDFSDFGLDAPEVYSYDEDCKCRVSGIDNYVNNCKYDENYSNVISQLQEIAEKEYSVSVIDVEGNQRE